MELDDRNQPLNLISTLWSVVCQARCGSPDARMTARSQILERYGGAVHRYLSGALRDAEAVQEVFQEFALCVLQGGLRTADPQRGRFRDFARGVLTHLIADYFRGRRPLTQPLPSDATLPAPMERDVADSDRKFLESWRDELLARAWAALAQADRDTGSCSYAVLRFRVEHARMRSPQMAEQLSATLARPLTAAGVRQLLHRARERFAQLLLEEVAQSLESPSGDEMEQELIELDLHKYCRTALRAAGLLSGRS